MEKLKHEYNTMSNEKQKHLQNELSLTLGKLKLKEEELLHYSETRKVLPFYIKLNSKLSFES
jgi:hypothetical protein